jgi:hypothetical protein
MSSATPYPAAPQITTINITNVPRAEDAANIVAALHGKTYMNFRVTLCPAYGSVDVNVETDYDADEKEITGMVLMVMAGALRRATPAAE